MEKKFKRTLVTTALPYANGPVHIGHLAGVYVPADIYTRYMRLRGEDVVMVGGSDEHGVPITIKAREEGVTPQDIVDRYHKIIKVKAKRSLTATPFTSVRSPLLLRRISAAILPLFSPPPLPGLHRLQ